MNGRTFRHAASAAAIATTAVLGTTALAYAEPEPAPKTPVEIGIDHLVEVAGDNEDAKTAVQSAAKTAQLITAAKLGNVAFAPFAYQALTIGCGRDMPFTMTAASGVSGGSPDSLGTAPGSLRFQAVTAHSGMPLASGLSVVWLNVNNGRSGINMLDDVSEYNLPALSKTVDSGAGTVIASLWGTIDYPGARCLVTPTVGLFTVPDLPPEPKPEAAKPETPAVENAPAPSGSSETGSGIPGL